MIGSVRTSSYLMICLTAATLNRDPFDILRGPTPADQEQARRRAADFATRQTIEQYNAFAKAWNAFLAEYSEHGTFNVKKARAALRAWRKIETSLPR